MRREEDFPFLYFIGSEKGRGPGINGERRSYHLLLPLFSLSFTDPDGAVNRLMRKRKLRRKLISLFFFSRDALYRKEEGQEEK